MMERSGMEAKLSFKTPPTCFDKSGLSKWLAHAAITKGTRIKKQKLANSSAGWTIGAKRQRNSKANFVTPRATRHDLDIVRS
jgi:hypothetical protein